MIYRSSFILFLLLYNRGLCPPPSRGHQLLIWSCACTLIFSLERMYASCGAYPNLGMVHTHPSCSRMCTHVALICRVVKHLRVILIIQLVLIYAHMQDSSVVLSSTQLTLIVYVKPCILHVYCAACSGKHTYIWI